MNLQQAVQKVVKHHGSQSATARVAQISPTYMSKLFHGHTHGASKAVLRKLGIRMTKSFELRTKH